VLAESLDFWKSKAKGLIKLYFRNALTEAEEADSFDLRHSVDIPHAFARLQELTGIHCKYVSC
jgi:hypothetical protein